MNEDVKNNESYVIAKPTGQIEKEKHVKNIDRISDNFFLV